MQVAANPQFAALFFSSRNILLPLVTLAPGCYIYVRTSSITQKKEKFMPARRAVVALFVLFFMTSLSVANAQIPTPEKFLGFRVGEDKKLARWDKIVAYLNLIAKNSDRVRVRELGKTTENNPFLLLEIASPETLKNLDRYKQLERKLYFQGGRPTDAERDEIFRSGKAVVMITCAMHATEIGASQMVIELVHRLATEDSPVVKKILDKTIFLLVPCLNPDGQIMVTDWYNKNLGTEFENSPMPYLYQKYVGHDNNRDMYMFTQKESQMTAEVLWHDWFPSVWLDEHQQGSNGARIFVMPATDPINPNVHPLIYRWNGILGQAQAAALEAAGKEGIIYNSTYTNFWQGAMAWSGWWHNQIGLLTEVASARIASPIEQRRATPGSTTPASPEDFQAQLRRQAENPNEPLPPPTDTRARTEYPRPWLGGRWTLRDIVDYELIATMALLETAADQREQLLRQIYEVNRATVVAGKQGDTYAIVIDAGKQQDARAANHLVERLQIGGVEVYRATSEFEVDAKKFPKDSFVIPMNQVFARYAKDLLEKQVYPEVRRSPNAPPEPPYDVTAWSLGMQMGVATEFLKKPLPETLVLQKLEDKPRGKGEVRGAGKDFQFDYRGADSAIAINRLLKEGAKLEFRSALENGLSVTRVAVANIGREKVETIARATGLSVMATDAKAVSEPKPARKKSTDNQGEGQIDVGKENSQAIEIRAPRIGLYQAWTANMDEGWTRWVLEQYEFAYTTLHNADVKAGKLRDKFEVIVLPDQQPQSILAGNSARTTRPEYRGGLGEEGLEALRQFVKQGGTLVTLGAASDLAIDKFPIPVKNLKRGLTREQHFAPGTILRIQVDSTHPVSFGMPEETYGFYNNSPFFALTEGFSSQRASVVARYPNADVVGSGWLKGEELMTGRGAIVAVEMNPGRIILFGLRPQHRAQTHATFPMLFNALYRSATENRASN
jgi:hypothetical protein